LVWQRVLASIQLNYQLFLRAIKIEDVAAEYDLTAKLLVLALLVAEQAPQ
jgi:hypothetical protein